MSKYKSLIISMAMVTSTIMSPAVMSEPSNTHANDDKLHHVARPVKGQYIVIFDENKIKKSNMKDLAHQLAQSHGANVKMVYESGLRGFVVNGSEEQMKMLSRNPMISYVEEDSVGSIDATQLGATQGLDRIDQANLPLDASYTYVNTGSGVHAYVVDSGIYTSHADFGGRASADYNVINDGYGATDCLGHGTHVAGTIGSATWGVAKSVRLHSVRVAGCTVNVYSSDVIAGVNWVTTNHVKPAVMNMSLGFPKTTAVDDAVRVAINAGVTAVVAAGNTAVDACNISPAGAREAITVAATDTQTDQRASFSNYGSCVDLFAPGVAITSTWISGGTYTMNGTSMAAPHVAGAVALYLEGHPTAGPADIPSRVITNTTMNKVGNAYSPNHLAHVPFTSSDRLAFYKYANTITGAHLYTRDWNELGGAGLNGWNYQGASGFISKTQVTGTVPLYRYYNAGIDDTYLTKNWNFLGYGAGGYVFVRIEGYIPSTASAETTNLYAYYFYLNNFHYYTTNYSEFGGGSAGWIYEGVVGQVYTAP